MEVQGQVLALALARQPLVVVEALQQVLVLVLEQVISIQ